MNDATLVLILGDQLSLSNPALACSRPGRDIVLMAEVHEETHYVRHNRHKIVFILSAMRHFRQQLVERGFEVIYYSLGDDVSSLDAAVQCAFEQTGPLPVRVCQPGEQRLADAFATWEKRLKVPVTVMEDTRFLATQADFESWARGRKQLRMEYFYRVMRKRYQLLLEADGKPVGGRWNFDQQNRKGWRSNRAVPVRPAGNRDAITAAVITEVEQRFPDNPGQLADFYCAVSAGEAQRHFDWFCENALGQFGTWQDAMADESPWLFHSLVAMYINVGLLDPLQVCLQVEKAWRDGSCELSDAEGFIRQVLGWREYIRGVYWLLMPGYRERNALGADRPLPDWFWTAKTDLHCLHRALAQSLDLGYAHHIQRLMIIGNFALLAGLEVKAVCEWYLAVYVDAFEWVELPNTLGMALYADGGVVASKPYAASGKYIQRQGNYCAQCRYNPAEITGAKACPFNSLYWRFIDRHQEMLSQNGRASLMLANWRRRSGPEQEAIVRWADDCLRDISGPAS